MVGMYASASSTGFPSAHQPVVRSRTLLFLSYRDSRVPSASSYPPPRIDKGKGRASENGYAKGVGAAGEEGQRLLNGDGEVRLSVSDDAPGNGLPPRWVDYSDQVELLLEGIKTKMAHLDKMTAKHVLPGFNDRSAEEALIERVTQDITHDFRRCQAHIRKIADYAKYMRSVMHQAQSASNSPVKSKGKGREGPPSTEKFHEKDLVMATNVQIALATKVQDQSAIFRKRQSNYLKQLKGFEVQAADLLAASGAGPIKDDPLLALEADESLSRSSLANPSSPISSHSPSQTQTQTQVHSNYDLEDIHQRDREITGIATSITELSDLFKDLSHLVIDQGTLLDRVDYNVERMNEHVRGAVEELKVATHYQRRSGKCRLIFLLVLLIFGAIIVLVYKPRRSSSSTPSLSSPNTAPNPLPAAGRAGEEPHLTEPVAEADEHGSGSQAGRRLAGNRGVNPNGGDSHAQRVIGGWAPDKGLKKRRKRSGEEQEGRRRRRRDRWA